MTKRQQVVALLALGWSFRRIERETGVRRETISKYSRPADPNAAEVFSGESGPGEPGSSLEGGEDAASLAGAGPNAAKAFPGSLANAAKAFAGSRVRPRSSAAPFREAILEKLELGLTIQRVYQDLQEEYGYGRSYESVKRYVRKLARRRRAAGVMHSLPGEEGQVDFFRGAPTLDAATGEWRRPWVFRMTLCHSRHGYEEAVWDQKVETFLRLHENAFRDLGGVVKVVRHDNLKAAVVRACLYDPDVNAVYEAFSKHWGFTALPTKPRNPRENGKQERSGGYVKSNALKGRRFGSLDEQNRHLRHWNRTIARLRIHGTTRKQVFTHYEETDQKTLQPLAAEPFPIFERGTRTVHPDGHVEVDGAFYPVSPHLLGEQVEVRWDARLVRVFHGETPVAVHTRVRPGGWARRPGEQHQEPTSSQRAYVAKLIGTCARVGRPLQEWAEAAYVERGVRALRLIQGALHLVRKHPREAVLHAAKKALANHLFRYKDLRRLTEQADSAPAQRSLLDVHETHSAYERVPTGGPAVNPTLLTKLRHLRLSGMAEALPARLAQAEGGSMSFLEFLELLVEDELHRRADRLFARRVKQATISTIKELKDFDWAFNPKIPKTRIVELVSGRFVAQHADALLIGPPGLGKSHIVTAIALGAIRAGYRALVRSAFDLSQDFVEAEALGQRKDFVKRLTTVDALIIEDFGMKKLGPSAAEDLLEVFVRRHENASTVVTTNRPTQDWGVFLGDVPAATAILDRFLSRAQIIQLEGKSYRLHQQRVKQTEEASA